MTDEEIKALIDACLNASNEYLAEMRRENREIKERLVKLESIATLMEIVETE